jgi:dihydropyrimidine dehydrogenase (NAD+) subunit PreA
LSTDIGHIATKTGNAGADALSAINTISAIIGVDIEREIPIPNVKGYSALGGLSGPAVRPVALRCIHEIRQASSLPISGIGGVEDWRSSVEFILMGASTIQLCTQVMWKGYDIIEKLTSGLTSYMDKKRYNNIADFCGNASKKIVQHPMLELQPGLHAQIDTEKCTGCGLCVTACRDGAFNALTMENKKAKVNPERCDCCGLCQIVCRFDAVRFV